MGRRLRLVTSKLVYHPRKDMARSARDPSSATGYSGLVPAPLRADMILVSTLNGPIRAATPIGDPSFWAAQSFQTDNASYTLSNIQALVGGGQNLPVVIAQLRRADAMGQIDQSPSGLLDTLIPPDVSGSQSVRTFTPTGTVALDPNTVYWFILGEVGPGSYLWTYENTAAPIGPGSIPNPDFADSQDSGTTWNYNPGFNDPYEFQVNVNSSSVVPEPSSVALAGIGLFVAGVARWARRRRNR
jgi:hypothetical protein